MNQKKYIKSICKRLLCTRTKKKEIAKQLQSDIQSVIAQGETMEEVCERMGNARELADEFNENMPEDEIRKARKDKSLKLVGVILGMIVVIGVIFFWMLPKTKPMGDSSIFESEQVEQRCISIIQAFDAKNYHTLQSEYAAEVMKPYLAEENMEQAKKTISDDWGKQTLIGDARMVEVTQRGKKFALAEINVSYENISVIYTITLDSDYKLVGFYMR